jgi:hypothetical protein
MVWQNHNRYSWFGNTTCAGLKITAYIHTNLTFGGNVSWRFCLSNQAYEGGYVDDITLRLAQMRKRVFACSEHTDKV